jgi:nucleoside-diphosphate-sugar epimerase
MNVFLTGASGYIGGVVAEKLLAAGHSVMGLARSEESARKLEAVGVCPVPGNLRDVVGLASSAREADGVIHAGTEWGPERGPVDRTAAAVMTEALADSGKPFVYTSGNWLHGNTGDAVVHDDAPVDPPAAVAWRPEVERLVLDATERGVRSIVIRPAEVYGRGGGLAGEFVKAGKENGVVRYVGDGENYWSFVHVEPLARLYVLALERARPGAILLAAAGPQYRVRTIAGAAAAACGGSTRAESWPAEEARKTLGDLVDGLIQNQRLASERAQRELGWNPAAPSVLEEIARSGGTPLAA